MKLQSISLLLLATLALAEHGKDEAGKASRALAPETELMAINDFRSFRLRMHALECLKPGTIVVDSFRLSQDSSPLDIKTFEAYKGTLFKNSDLLFKNISKLIAEKKVPAGLFLYFQLPMSSVERGKKIEVSEGKIDFNLLHSPSVEEIEKALKKAKASSDRKATSVELELEKLKCELIAKMGVFGGIAFDGPADQAQVALLKKLIALSSEGYRLDPKTEFFTISGGKSKNPKPYFFYGQKTSLVIPPSATVELIKPFLHKPK